MPSENMQLQDALIGLIVSNTDKEFWIALRDNIPEAFKRTSKIIDQEFPNIPRSRPLPQFLRYKVDNTLVGIFSSIKPEIMKAPCDGEFYVLLTSESGKLTISHVIIGPDERGPTRAAHRDSISLKNKPLAHRQIDMFNEELNEIEELSDSIHVALNIFRPSKKSENQDVPAQILVTVPFYSNWNLCHLRISLDQLIKSYDKKPVDVYDGAWGTLKDVLVQEEENTGID